MLFHQQIKFFFLKTINIFVCLFLFNFFCPLLFGYQLFICWIPIDGFLFLLSTLQSFSFSYSCQFYFECFLEDYSLQAYLCPQHYFISVYSSFWCFQCSSCMIELSCFNFVLNELFKPTHVLCQYLF